MQVFCNQEFGQQMKKGTNCIRKNLLNRKSYMSAQVLLNLLYELGEEIKCEACRAFYRFFASSLLNSIKHEQSCKILLKNQKSHQASIQCWAIFGTPAKRHLNGVSLAGR